MLASEQGRVEASVLSRFKYDIQYAAGNSIGVEGCKHLSIAGWDKLSSLDLTNN